MFRRNCKKKKVWPCVGVNQKSHISRKKKNRKTIMLLHRTKKRNTIEIGVIHVTDMEVGMKILFP